MKIWKLKIVEWKYILMILKMELLKTGKDKLKELAAKAKEKKAAPAPVAE